MKYYSTKNKSNLVDLKTAVLRSLPSDNGLYMPERIDPLGPAFFQEFQQSSFQDNSFRIAHNLIGDSIPQTELEGIINKSINFPAPLQQLTENIYTQELWHGPSLAFKDFGARFMAALMSYLVKHDDEKLSIIVATSGDTGGAVAAGFFGIENIDVTILFPKGKVSPLQELQLTTWGGNIKALAIDGTFDDCQTLVKAAFLDSEINKERNLSSANSINIARLIPQSFYYFEAVKQLSNRKKPIVISVPSGNFGNLTAGLIAKHMGLPVARFLAATNVNNIVPHYLATGTYDPRPSKQTIANAMDVGSPSNFQRLMDLYNEDWNRFTTDVEGYYYTDEDTRFGLKYLSKTFNYIADPHGAIGFLALHQYLKDHPGHQGVFLETAHPAKFLPVMEPVLGKLNVPSALTDLRDKDSYALPMKNDFAAFKEWLLS